MLDLLFICLRMGDGLWRNGVFLYEIMFLGFIIKFLCLLLIEKENIILIYYNICNELYEKM